MFSSFTSRLRLEVATLKRVLDTHDSLRALVFPRSHSAPEKIENPAGSPGEEETTADPSDQYLTEIREAAPPKPAWQVYDHCAAFTRLYAVYEQFIEELVSDYLRMLPALYPRYEDLPPNVTKQHRVGVGQILLKLGKDGPYKDFEEKEIIQGLSHGLHGQPTYTLLSDAFLIDPQNYRADTVVKLFSYIGLENCWPWVEKHPLMAAYMLQNRDSNETPRTLLHDFIENRNKASHTLVGDIVATEEIKSIADFVVVLSETLAQLLMKQVVERKKSLGEIRQVGSVLHKFSNNIVGVEMSAVELVIGDELIVVQKYACFKASVVSIRIHENPYQRLTTTAGQQIGIRLDAAVNEGAQLMKLPPPQPVLPLEELIAEPVSPDDDLHPTPKSTAETPENEEDRP
jgi:hypothetical protein